MHILVLGWYHHSNAGDTLFQEAFRHLFPHITFTFADHLDQQLLPAIDAIFFGGGSFLSSDFGLSEQDVNMLRQKSIFYLGVGTETEIHPVHLELMRQARLIASRSDYKLDRIIAINPNTILIPDLVYALPSSSVRKENKHILILPNINTIPKYTDPHWKHTSWAQFKSEFAQFLDAIIENGYSIKFLAMCQDRFQHDHGASVEILNKMQYRDIDQLMGDYWTNSTEVKRTLEQMDAVITMRYHGIVLSEMFNLPYLSIYHHDKLKKEYHQHGNFISYFAANKQSLLEQFPPKTYKRLYDPYVFDILKNSVLGAL